MPPCPEALVLMLAVTRIGAIHLVIVAGFGSVALAERIQLSGARWLWYVGHPIDDPGRCPPHRTFRCQRLPGGRRANVHDAASGGRSSRSARWRQPAGRMRALADAELMPRQR
jgi:acyl-coenzyme A synthetase/AMP-(fatty) acid ligase